MCVCNDCYDQWAGYKGYSKKDCCCGGHNMKNVSRNLNHNSTKRKLSIRKNRRFKTKITAKCFDCQKTITDEMINKVDVDDYFSKDDIEFQDTECNVLTLRNIYLCNKCLVKYKRTLRKI